VLRVGLTGGIACGKSEVLRRVAAAGLPTLDLDRVAHELMERGRPAYHDVVAVFGPGILAKDGSIDRRALGDIVFRDPEARERLNRLVHPRVREEEARRLRSLSSGPPGVLVTDAALLVEAGMHLRFDRLVVVHCRPEQQVTRLRGRDGLSEEDARRRVAAQMPIEWKRRFAHFGVDASLDLAATRAAADELARGLLEMAGRRPPLLPLLRHRGRGALLHGPSLGPRGSTPALLARHLAEVGGLEPPRFARTLAPPKEGAWYEPAPREISRQLPRPGRAPGAPTAAALCAPLVLFELVRHGHDEERIAAGAHSLAWMLEEDPSGIADSVWMALVLAEVARAGRITADLAERVAPLRTLAERWGQAEPGPLVPAVVGAALRHPQEAEAARSACGASGLEPGLAGALVGMASDGEGTGDGAWEPFLDALSATPE
jgi:dephospho-CoA kinase